ncbi:C4-dicarboxylate TRAP transporter substrate-binding protein [Alteribacillus bidgolensis]|uniref:TRAP-type C4-dicarboxylate transport system, substrate-binding protein n=1 Tax=Alteribacillus bidgolensis TaxID=930129 RepID=A0A1G8PJX0_9BACI|nr:C4-dicarboxylate TRAP transporter substrate-binding protein [Alteribacillus bidgolensis]SDI92773.1 TRAP-type C4-dicarboxylate transport system, substrate-binding protein [Alteribacillus bidgolensis]
MKNNILFILAILFLTVLAACQGDNSNASSSEENGGSSEGEYTLRVGITQNDQNAEFKGIEQFKEGVEERTNGDITVETYHSDQLASIPDLIEQASTGTNVGTITDAGQIGDIKNEFYILQSPYMFEDYEEIDKFLESDPYHEWVEEFKDNGLQILSFNFKLGERNLATNTKIETPEDLEGNVIRTNGSQIVNATVSGMGGSPSGMPWTEAYPGLEQGVIDGVEAHNLAIYESSLYEVIDHIAKTNHYQLVSGMVVSADWFSNLPEEYQDILIEEAQLAGDTASEIATEQSQEYEQAMKEEGVEFIEVDREKFKERAEDAFSEIGLEDVKAEIDEVLDNE